MAEEFPGGPAMAAQIALGGSAAEDARDYLRKQSRLTDLQIENLRKLDEYETSHLRWRRLNDQMKGAMQIMLVAVGLLIVVGIAIAMWNASQADGLIVDAFTVPPDFERAGMGGTVVAGDLTQKLAAIRGIAIGISFSISRDVSTDRADDIKVEIPDTGVSISEAWRYLRRWLGHERYLTGSVRELGDGRVALSVSLDGAGAMTVAGRPSDLPALEQTEAENVFAAFDPVNNINYLSAMGHYREAMDAAARYVPTVQGVMHADAYTLWSYTTAYATGDFGLALARTHIAMGIDPKLAVAHVMAARFHFFMGHQEAQLAENRAILSLRNEDQPPAHRHGGFDEMKNQANAQIALLLGDFANASSWNCGHSCTFAGHVLARAAMAARLHDLAQARALLDEGLAAGTTDPGEVGEVRYYMEAAAGDWGAALRDASRIRYTVKSGYRGAHFMARIEATYTTPLLAVAQAHVGDFAASHRSIEGTPADCVPCETARGDIDALERNYGGAAYWFGRAVHDAPSIPFADADWGQMLTARGDLDGAIAKFDAAHRKGPHFADPLELWGEALIAENRSDLALARFEDAARYAPNWGRLHLKWGEALLWSGHRDEARKQFAIAATLGLTASEKSELAKISHGG